MIQNTFLFLEKVKRGIEENLWKQGIGSWDSFLKCNKPLGLGIKRKRYYDRKIMEARKALYAFDSSYFKDLMPQSEYYRLYDFFGDDCIFLDIETTGLDFRNDDITVIGLFDGLNTKTMIKGINFDYKALKNELKNCKLIATFNGRSFDVPFINKKYPGLLPNVPNFDVKSVTDRLNLKGGLKEIEKKLGIKRNKTVKDFYGGDALALWRMYKATGDDYYLKLLVEYNEDDIVNLKKVADYCVAKLKIKLLKYQQSSP